jgi:hypothetical protein
MSPARAGERRSRKRRRRNTKELAGGQNGKTGRNRKEKLIWAVDLVKPVD